MLEQIREFFETRRSVVLVDLEALERPPQEEEAGEVELMAPSPKKQDEPKITPVVEKPKYVEDDPNYVPPPSELSPEAQKLVNSNLLEVFTFYSRKYASVRGDFEVKSQNLVVLALPAYTKFCKDFKVPLSTGEITTVWKKSSTNH